MNYMRRVLCVLLAAVLFCSMLPLSASAADELPFALSGGYISVNRFTGTLTGAVNLKGDLVIPAEVQGIPVTTIKEEVFYGFENLTSVTLPDSVTSIGDGAFGACTSLRTVTLGKNVTELGKDCFRYCYSLTSINLPSSLKSIGNYAFASCLKLSSISIPEGVTRLGSYVFAECANLSSVTLHAGIREIGDYTFNNCTSLKSIELPENLQAISIALFNGCSALTDVKVPSTVKSVGKSAFGRCTALTRLILPEGVEDLNDWAFNACKSLTDISLPSSVNSIAADTFYGCENVRFHVKPGTYAQVYASANNIPFVTGLLTDDPPQETYPETPFTDIQNHWGKPYIEWAYAQGYFKGITDTRFGPNVAVNRGMIVSVLYRMEGQPAAGSASFTDVADKAYYASAVAWGQSSGVVTGMGDGKFMPARAITREQLATMLYRYAKYKKLDTSKVGNVTEYKDYTSISTYAEAAMAWALGAGVVTGRTGAVLDPKGSATRAEAAAMLQRFTKLK